LIDYIFTNSVRNLLMCKNPIGVLSGALIRQPIYNYSDDTVSGESTWHHGLWFYTLIITVSIRNLWIIQVSNLDK